MASDQKSQARAEQRQQAMQELAVKVWLPGGQWWLVEELVPTDPKLMIWLPPLHQLKMTLAHEIQGSLAILDYKPFRAPLQQHWWWTRSYTIQLGLLKCNSWIFLISTELVQDLAHQQFNDPGTVKNPVALTSAVVKSGCWQMCVDVRSIVLHSTCTIEFWLVGAFVMWPNGKDVFQVVKSSQCWMQSFCNVRRCRSLKVCSWYINKLISHRSHLRVALESKCTAFFPSTPVQVKKGSLRRRY